MKYFLPLLFVCLSGCFAEGDSAALNCNSGVVETYTGVVDGLNVSVDHCLAIGWKSNPCEDGGSFCQYVYGPNQPGGGGTDLLFGDFMYGIRIDSVESYTLPKYNGPQTWESLPISEAGYAVKESVNSERYGGDSREMIIGCDHPDTDNICPFTWYRKVVTGVEDSLVVDVSGVFADFQDPNDVTTAPEEYDVYLDQMGSMRITVE
ncbi:MAG: hypothetical protein GWP91_20455 [Rhodobacterales bacterium]|nr:hypothetical protein [Rhodobacterales bacterium]